MTATYTFDVFTSLDGYGSYDPATGAATGASRAPSSSTTGSRRTTASSGWSSAPPRSGCSCRCWARAPRTATARPVDRPVAQLPTTVVSSTLKLPSTGRTRPSSAATPSRSCSAEGGVGRADPLPRQPLDEPRADGRRPRRPHTDDRLPGHHRPDRRRPDLRRVRPTSTSSCWRPGPSTAAPRSSPTGRPSTPDSRPRARPNPPSSTTFCQMARPLACPGVSGSLRRDACGQRFAPARRLLHHRCSCGARAVRAAAGG